MKKCVFFGWLLIFSLAFVAFSQSNDSMLWTRIETEDSDFSITLPNSYIVDKTRSPHRIFWSQNDVYFEISFEKTSSAVRDLQFSYAKKKSRIGTNFYLLGDYLIAEKRNPEDGKDTDYVSLQIATNKGFYTIVGNSKMVKNDIFFRFLYSIQLDYFYLYLRDRKIQSEIPAVSIGSVETSGSVFRALEQPESYQEKLIDAATDSIDVESQSGYSSGLIIIRKPSPSYTNEARISNLMGIVQLKVTFLATGRIGEIKLLKSLGKGLDQTAFDAAKKIKFIPAEKNGKQVDVERILEYRFTIY
jgi:TonB family protein